MGEALDKDIFRQETDLCGAHIFAITEKRITEGSTQIKDHSHAAKLLSLSEEEIEIRARDAKNSSEVLSEETQNERDKMGKPLNKFQTQAIQERCDAVVAANNLSTDEKVKIVTKCLRIIQSTRNSGLLSAILDESIDNFIASKRTDEFSIVDAVKEVNERAKSKLIAGEITVDEFSQFRNLKALLGDIVKEKINTLRLAAAEEIAHEISEENNTLKELEEVRNQIDGIIDKERNRSLHSCLAAIAQYLKGTLGEGCETVTIAYVNEENDYQQFDRLTRVIPRISDKKSSKGKTPHATEEITASSFPQEIFSSHINTKVTDGKGKKYFSLKLGKQCLGIIEVKMKDGYRLNEQQERKCEKAITVVDTFLDVRLMALRLDKLRKKITRILDRTGTDTVIQDGKHVRGLKKGLTDSLVHLCHKTGAELIHLRLDITGEKKHVPLTLTVSSEGEITEDQEDSTSMEQISRPITIPKGIVIDDNTETQCDGEITFFGRDLDEEDQKALIVAVEQIISATRNFRVDLNNTIRYGLPPKVARLLKEGRLQPSSVENISMSYTDIYGFTGISEKFQEITNKYGLKENYMVRLIAAYDQMAKEIAEEFGGCYDKIVGDCVIINAGPPYTTDGKDALNMSESNPIFHAMNSLKMALRIKKGLPKVEAVFKDLLLEMAEEIEAKTSQQPKKRKGKTSIRPSYSSEEAKEKKLAEFCDKYKFYPTIKVTQGISSGETSVGLVEVPDAQGKTFSTSYTVIGAEMNLAARLQAKATPEEIIISKATKDYIEQAIELNIPVPFTEDGKTETWEEFKKSYLGEDAERYNLVPVFEPTLLELKNISGYEFAYRLSFEKICTDRENPDSLPPIILEDSLKNMRGYFKIINQDPQGDLVEMTLENVNQPSQKFRVRIKNPKKEIRYVPEQDCDDRIANGSDNVLRVQNGEIIHTDYVTIEKLIAPEINKLNSSETYLPNQIPHGIYSVLNTFENEGTDDILYQVERNGKIIFIRLDKKSIQDIDKIPEKPKAQSLYEIHRYSFLKRRKAQQDNLRKQGIQTTKTEDQFLYIHTNGEFVGAIAA